MGALFRFGSTDGLRWYCLGRIRSFSVSISLGVLRLFRVFFSLRNRSCSHGFQRRYGCYLRNGCIRFHRREGLRTYSCFTTWSVFYLLSERTEELHLVSGKLLYERRESFFVWRQDPQEFSVLSQIPEEAREIPISGYDERLIVPIVIDHRLQDHLGIYIPLHFTRFGREDFLEYYNEAGFLEHEIEILISWHES